MNKWQYNYDVSSAVSLIAGARRSERVSSEGLADIQRRRFARLLEHSRKNSPFYQRHFHSVRGELSLSRLEELPTVTKAIIMENFDDVLTDRSLGKAAILKFAEDSSNLGSMLRERYFVARTSGTTGLVGHYVHDLFSYFLINVLTAARSKGLKPFSFLTNGHLLPRRLRAVSLLSPAANLGVASVIASTPKWARLFIEFNLIDIFEPWEKTVEKLNEFQPDVVGSFPTILEQLADSQSEGRLCIRPQTVRSGGEMLMPRIRKHIAEAFHCEVYDCYGCAECGWVGMECEQQSGIHVFSDWFIVEPVDEQGRPVPPGVESDKILITNLANYAQPFIRFELPDRVTVLEGDCPCGNVLPRVSLKGRASEVLYLAKGDSKKAAVPPFHLTTLAEMVPGIQRYQIIQEDPTNISVLFTARSGVDPRSVHQSLKNSFDDYLEKNGLSPYTALTVQQTDAIQRDPSGKVKQVFSRVNVN